MRKIARAVEHVDRHRDRADAQCGQVRKDETLAVLAIDRNAIAGADAPFFEFERDAQRTVVHLAVREIVERKRVAAVGERGIKEVEQQAAPPRERCR